MLNPRSEIQIINAEIISCVNAMRENWARQKTTGAPEYEAAYAQLRARIVTLQERRVEIERELEKEKDYYAART